MTRGPNVDFAKQDQESVELVTYQVFVRGELRLAEVAAVALHLRVDRSDVLRQAVDLY